MKMPIFGWLVAAVLMTAAPVVAQTSFVTFESGHVRPLARTPSGAKLLALNTPDNRLEVFVVTEGGLVRVSSIPVGMEPVAVAARNETEVWVVNHLSDSVSIVDLGASPPRVVRTLLVGDEPRDIVFAGTSGNRAFITTAHRGQHRTHASILGVTGSGDPQLKDEGIDRADVWVFDAGSLGATIGGTPVEIVSFFADTPRALAVSADGNTVYAAAFHSGNQTTVVLETMVCDGFDSAGTCGRCVSTAGTTCEIDDDCPGGDTCNLISPGGVPGPNTSVAGAGAPETGLIVKWDGAAWRDAANKNWTRSGQPGRRHVATDRQVPQIDECRVTSRGAGGPGLGKRVSGPPRVPGHNRRTPDPNSGRSTARRSAVLSAHQENRQESEELRGAVAKFLADIKAA